MSPKFHSVPCQGHHAITGPGDSTDLDVKKCGLSDGQIKPGCEKGFGACSSERMARKALLLLCLCVNCVAYRPIYGTCPWFDAGDTFTKWVLMGFICCPQGTPLLRGTWWKKREQRSLCATFVMKWQFRYQFWEGRLHWWICIWDRNSKSRYLGFRQKNGSETNRKRTSPQKTGFPIYVEWCQLQKKWKTKVGAFHTFACIVGHKYL
jgi:hypothetical protein